jgi:hypothetical protein
MASDRGPRSTRLLVFWLIVSGARVHLDTGWYQDTRENVAHPASGASTPGSAGESSFPLFFYLAGRENSGFLLAPMTLKVRRRRGSGAPASEHRPVTSLRPLSHSHGDRLLTTPVISSGHLLAHSVSAREIFVAVQGTGAYLALIYLQTIEKNPGPNELDQTTLIAAIKSAVNAEIKPLHDEISSLRSDFLKRVVHTEKEVKVLREENSLLHRRISQLERYTRRKNVVIFGVPDDVPAEGALATLATGKLSLERVPPIAAAYRIGKGAERRPILVKLCSQQDKELIMSNVGKLRGTKISINDDLTPEEQAVRRTIVAASKAAKERGIFCKVRRTGLLVNDRLVPSHELCSDAWMDQLEGSASGRNSGKRTSDEILSPPLLPPGVDELFFTVPRSDPSSRQTNMAGAPKPRLQNQPPKKSKNK